MKLNLELDAAISTWKSTARAGINFTGVVSVSYFSILTVFGRFDNLQHYEFMTMIVRPDLKSRTLLAQLTKGVGHNSYGEQAWPNDLLYMFPISILGVFGAIVSFAVLEPTPLGEPADPYATPFEILPEWFLFPTFQILRVVPNKLLGIALIAAVPLGLIAIPFLEAGNRFQNPVRRPIASIVFVSATIATVILGRDATRSL